MCTKSPRGISQCLTLCWLERTGKFSHKLPSRPSSLSSFLIFEIATTIIIYMYTVMSIFLFIRMSTPLALLILTFCVLNFCVLGVGNGDDYIVIMKKVWRNLTEWKFYNEHWDRRDRDLLQQPFFVFRKNVLFLTSWIVDVFHCNKLENLEYKAPGCPIFVAKQHGFTS